MLKKTLSVIGFIFILSMAVIGGQIGKEIGKDFFSPSKPSEQEIEAKLIEGFQEGVDQISQKLPMMIDEETRLDRATVGPGARAVYHHTFVNYSSSDIGSEWLKTSLKPEVMGKVCATEKMKQSLQYGGIYVYAYSGSDGIEITRFEIDRSDCGY